MANGGRPSLPDIDSVDDMRAVDLKVAACRALNPSWSVRKISDETGIPKSSVWDSLQRMRKGDWVEDIRKELRTLAPKSIDAIDDGMEYGEHKDRAAVGLRVLSGLGVLVDKTDNTQRNAPVSADEFLESFERMSTEEQDRIIAGLTTRGNADGTGGAGQPHAPVVDGDKSSPDA